MYTNREFLMALITSRRYLGTNPQCSKNVLSSTKDQMCLILRLKAAPCVSNANWLRDKYTDNYHQHVSFIALFTSSSFYVVLLFTVSILVG